MTKEDIIKSKPVLDGKNDVDIVYRSKDGDTEHKDNKGSADSPRHKV